MRYLTDDQRWKRQRNADTRNLKNYYFLIEEHGFDEDTAWLIACTLADTRHWFHANRDRIFNCESGEASQFFGYDDGACDDISRGLAVIDKHLGTNYRLEVLQHEDYITESDYRYELAFEGSSDPPTYDECYDKWMEQAEELNDLIERAMREFDSKYGTDIAPTGISRVGLEHVQ